MSEVAADLAMASQEDEREWERRWPQTLAMAHVVENLGRFTILIGGGGVGFGEWPTRAAAHSYLYRERKKVTQGQAKPKQGIRQ